VFAVFFIFAIRIYPKRNDGLFSGDFFQRFSPFNTLRLIANFYLPANLITDCAFDEWPVVI
jgi:hypothetical protein